MNQHHVMFVCTSCESAHRTKQAIRTSGGERLLRQLQSLQESSSLEGLSIIPTECLGACEQNCTIALSASCKYTYLFGNLPVDDERLDETAAAVMTGASQYYAKSDGTLSYIQCPELLKKNVLAKIPPLPEHHSHVGGV